MGVATKEVQPHLPKEAQPHLPKEAQPHLHLYSKTPAHLTTRLPKLEFKPSNKYRCKGLGPQFMQVEVLVYLHLHIKILHLEVGAWAWQATPRFSPNQGYLVEPPMVLHLFSVYLFSMYQFSMYLFSKCSRDLQVQW